MNTTIYGNPQIDMSHHQVEELTPVMAPQHEVMSFASEAEAFEYSLSHARKVRGRFSAAQAASELRWSAANMTKIRQEQAGLPMDSSLPISEITSCYALQQYRNEQHGFVTKTREQEDEDLAELYALRKKNKKLNKALKQADERCVELKHALSAGGK